MCEMAQEIPGEHKTAVKDGRGRPPAFRKLSQQMAIVLGGCVISPPRGYGI